MQRNQITTLNGMIYERNIAFQDATNSIATLNHQVEQLDLRLTEIKTVAATNEQLVVLQNIEMARLELTGANLSNQVIQYKTAVDTLSSKLKEAYAGIEQQNQSITNLVEQRDGFVKKFNDSVNDRNDVVARYNDLVSQIQKKSGNGAKQ